MDAIVVDDPDDLESWAEPWDGLAQESSRPFCSPAWMLAWWHHESPADASLRAIVVVDDAGELLAVAPFFAHRAHGGLTRYRSIASARGTPIEPLARPGREADAARVIAEQLGAIAPRPDLVTLEGATSGWTARISEAWVGRYGSIRLDRTSIAPVLDLTARTFDEWFSSRSKNLRRHLRADERALGRHGFSAHVATEPDEIERALTALATQHLERWRKRGGSRVWRPGTLAMLREVEERLRATGRFRLATIDDGSDVIGAQLFVAAGRHLSSWLGSFDDVWAKYHPWTVVTAATLRDAWAEGYEHVDFGQGLQPYKLRLADERQGLAWMTLIPGGIQGVRTRVFLAPGRGMRAAAGHLPQSFRWRIRERLRR